MHSSLSKIYCSLFGIAIILMPFNDLPFLKGIFGELASEGAFYPFLGSIVTWLLYFFMAKNRICLPRNFSFKVLLLFVLWLVISSIVNLPDVIVAQNKGRSGIEKFVFQLVVLSFVMLTALFVYNVYKNSDKLLLILRKCALISFFITGAYAILEMSSMLCKA